MAAHESRFLEVIIDIPDKEKPLHYNERWEIWIIISESYDQSSDTGAFIQTELVAKFFIITPSVTENTQTLQFLFFILIAIIVVITVCFLFIKKQKRIPREDKQITFYFKKRKKL
jgi:hypothetical protein